MRDGIVTDMFQRFEKAVEHDVANLVKQNALNRARIYAIERVLFGSRWFLLKAILLSVFSPAKLKERINMAHAAEVEDFNQAMAKRADNGKQFKII